VFRSGRRKPKWQENPPPLKACRFDSDLGQSQVLRPVQGGARDVQQDCKQHRSFHA